MAGRKRKYSQHMIDEVLDKYKAGAKLYELEVVYGVAANNIRSWINRYGVNREKSVSVPTPQEAFIARRKIKKVELL